jgi:zinc D-Ala-D-Ala carboxypeptidase
MKMSRYTIHIILALVLGTILFYIFMPYFTESFSSTRAEIEIAESNNKLIQRELEKQRAQKEREQNISYLLGDFDPASHERFVLIPREYRLMDTDMYLRVEAYEAYLKMREAAAAEGVSLLIASATRNFDYQKGIWERKWNAGTDLAGEERFRRILEYSAAPGTSRHHWGTEIDINDANPEYFDSPKGVIEYQWLEQNAHRFGFCQTYTEKNLSRITGYEEEKWHWSYLPLSRGFTRDYRKHVTADDIKGFLGDEYAEDQNLIGKYVLGIDPECI